MQIFLAGASGAIGRRLVPLLRDAGHSVAGTTRRVERAQELRRLGAAPVIVDVFDRSALIDAVASAHPEVVIHQLTDLPSPPGTPAYDAGLERNARLRIEGTANLVAAAKAAGVKRLVAQSIAFVYAAGEGASLESDALDLAATGMRRRTVDGVAALERETLSMPEGIVLRYGFLYGPGTWFENDKRAAPALHVDAAAHAALLALTRGEPGIYNIAEDDGAVSTVKAKQQLGFDASVRLRP
jgi:nucleoside-diphosphate-sugar epimerase